MPIQRCADVAGDADPRAAQRGCGQSCECSADAAEAKSAGSAVRSVVSRPGTELDPDVRASMQGRFQSDFSDVRVHDDGEAAASARVLGAHAYTVGNHIVFAAGRYDPASADGQRTLSHELAHVVQQRTGPVSGLPIGDDVTVSQPGDPFEQAAENSARDIMTGTSTLPSSGSASGWAGANVPRLSVQLANTGGPYHPPEGTELSCSMLDDCSTISTKINYLKHTIQRHQEWDAANPDPAYPLGRHAAEIADLQRALANCLAIASTKCRGQPVWIPAPEPERQETPQERADRVKQQLYDALPWAVAVVVVGLIVACVLIEPCGAAVLAAVAAIAGEEAVAIVLQILVANGVRMGTAP